MESPDREKRTKKQYHKMGKVVAKAWDLGDDFHAELQKIGQKLDAFKYKLGRTGWGDFAQDLGCIYNHHIQRKTKKASQAEQHLQAVLDLLRHKDETLAQLAVSATDKKRSREDEPQSPKKRKNQNSDLAQREERAMAQLVDFIAEHGGSKDKIANFTARVTKKGNGKFDTNYFNDAGRRFRSMLEVGRHFGLVSKAKPIKRVTNKTHEAEKKKVRKELERLRKALQRAQKSLDEFNADKPTNEPIDDRLLPPKPHTCAAARKCDITGFPNVPDYCVPDVLMAWDFLCTFERSLNLTPIDLDDFCAALAFVPPPGDEFAAPPVFVAEAHLALLQFILRGKGGEEWWSSIYEVDGIPEEETEVVEVDESKPVIKVDMASLLGEVEDPLITTSWLHSLDLKDPSSDIKGPIKAALKIMTNKYCRAYLRKLLEKRKSLGPKTSHRALQWLVDIVRRARPDLYDSSITKDIVFQRRAQVVEDLSSIMDALPESIPSITDDDILSDDEEEDSDDESDDEGGDGSENGGKKEEAASPIPQRPTPTHVDLLLPPDKPNESSEFLNPFTWPQLVGASACRIIHHKKRVLNEMDDRLRDVNDHPPINHTERNKREGLVASRILTECVAAKESDVDIEMTARKICSGDDYFKLSFAERLSLLRLLIEAAYDSGRVFEVVDNNYKQRTSAMKALEQEERKAKKDAKDKAIADEVAAREKLAYEARERFFDEKREEIRKLNEQSQQLTEDVLEGLTDEDILDFDDDYKADYEALPAPESFSKMEVAYMVNRMKEEEAFDADAIRVVSLDHIVHMEKHELEQAEQALAGLGGEEALQDPATDRSVASAITSKIREVERLRNSHEKFPEQRQKAIEQLKDAMEDGTMKVLRAAITAAKRAKLVGPDDETGGKWVLDLLRDAALELESAKQNKKVIDARKDLVAKRNKCFIRSEPIGYDRHGNRFWSFEEGQAQFWVEAEFLLEGQPGVERKEREGYTDLVRPLAEIETKACDMEDDFFKEKEDKTKFLPFSRHEHHSSGGLMTLSKHHWGCLAKEETIRAVIRSLDGKGTKESALKTYLKEILEQTVGEKHDAEKVEEEQNNEAAEEVFDSPEQTSGDEKVFAEAKESGMELDESSRSSFGSLTTAIGCKVRSRTVLSEARDYQVARYENGEVVAWKIKRETQEVYPEMNSDDEEEDFEPNLKTIETPVWKVISERHRVLYLNGSELMESISRFDRFKSEKNYFEQDSSFLSYRNQIGKFCGKANEAAYASTPVTLAGIILRKEAELYSKLKIRSYDNNWGGKSGNRAVWINTMKDFTYDIQALKQGLLTMENAFFELTGEFDGYADMDLDTVPGAAKILEDPAAINQLELESYAESKGLWNNPESRAVYIFLVSNASSIGLLGLAFDLLCRNTTRYLKFHKLLNVRTTNYTDYGESYIEPVASRRARRVNYQPIPEDWF